MHGKIGDLEFENSQKFRIYKNIPIDTIDEDFFKMSQSLSVIHELDSPNQNYIQANQAIQNAEKVIFMGFGYHEGILKNLNLNLNEKNKYYLLSHSSKDDLEKRLKSNPLFKFCDILPYSYNCDNFIKTRLKEILV